MTPSLVLFLPHLHTVLLSSILAFCKVNTYPRGHLCTVIWAAVQKGLLRISGCAGSNGACCRGAGAGLTVTESCGQKGKPQSSLLWAWTPHLMCLWNKSRGRFVLGLGLGLVLRMSIWSAEGCGMRDGHCWYSLSRARDGAKPEWYSPVLLGSPYLGARGCG